MLGKTNALIHPLLVLALALAINGIVALFNRPLNRMVIEKPIFLSIDLLFSAFILAISGGSHSPYYLYALSPLLAGAFFFQVRGALTASLLFTPLFIFANTYNPQTPSDAIVMATQLSGIWLLPLLFAYPSTLLKSVNQATDELSAAHRQLEIIHDLTVLLQAAPDLISVQERVLGAVVTDLGFSKAVVAMVDPTHEEIGGWLVYPREDSFPQTKALSLKSENGEVIKALLNRNSFVTEGKTLIQDPQLNNWLAQNQWFVMPLYLREHPVGILLVEESGLTKEKESTLMTVANQAALALGTTILCIDRARRLAVETERNRIARDIHDTVAQSLFGIVYSLDACITMLPQQADDVKKELIDLRSLANTAHDEVRRSIFDLWPSALNIELFMADLTNYVSGCCRPRTFSIIFNNHGDFNSLSSGMRRTVYRMAQEALANSARHSGAQSARLCLTVTDEEVYLVVSDEGKGFDPSIALSRSQNREHFGLHGIQERARAMGGDCEINSQPNAGARIMIQLPNNGHHHHA
ncbi:sensor histidine kinase [Candidatus Villigracilis affinis]|uniref:GAF domain-containing sensor histidine kinase n=1 Tax=Candidatus Villigracilis affinis TaxID=3140682 RepID=UPI002A1FE802|nr:sensor histidine kinase [Anaerolineales bacterium]